jgi:hypothetical protein
MDFFRSLASILRAELTTKHYRIPPGWTDGEVVEGYVNLVRRQIPVAPRQVCQSAELVCPPEHASGLQELFRKIIAGEPLKPHQSRSLKKPSFNDGLFTDWGVQHFHLGTRIENDGFVNRTGPVLFALYKGMKFYAIQIYEHGAWAKSEVVRLLRANWPMVTTAFELKGIKPITPELDEQQIADLRKAGIMHLVQADGVFVYPMGGGVVSTGDSARLVEDVSNLRSNCCELEELIRNELQSDTSLLGVQETDLELARDGNFLVVRDRISGKDLGRSEWLIKADLQ